MAFILLGTPLWAAQHTLTDSEVTVVDGVLVECTYSFSRKEIIIPNTLQGQVITAIKNDVWPHIFSGKGLESVILPTTLTMIGDNVFANNNDLKIVIRRNVRSIGNNTFSNIKSFDIESGSALKTIGNYAFRNHSKDFITLPDSIISIGTNAFKCDNVDFYFRLPSPTEPDFKYWQNQDGKTFISGDVIKDTQSSYFTNLSYRLSDDDVEVVNDTLVSCAYDFSRKYLVIPDSLDGQVIKVISAPDFSNRDIASVTLPAELKSIGRYTFYYNNISQLIIPAKVNLIEESAFENNLVDSLRFEVNSELRTVGTSAFENHRMNKLSLPKTVISIEKDAFYSYYNKDFSYSLPNQSGLEKTQWLDDQGNSYESGDIISSHSRTYYTTQIYVLKDEDVVVEDGLIVSCTYDFSLKYIEIPEVLDGQTVVGVDDGNPYTGVFANKNMYQVSFPKTLKILGDYEFLDLTSNHIGKLSIPPLVERIGRQTFTSRADTLVFEEESHLKIIDNYAFDNHVIDQLTLPNSVIAIGSYAFRCNNPTFSFALPHPSEPDFVAWYDDKGREYEAGDVVSDLSASYYTNLSYTLTDQDVVVENGVIVSCSYDFRRKRITIPPILDGQVIKGIDDGVENSGVFQNKNIVELILPATLDSIGDYEFHAEGFGTSIDSLIIPQSVISIGEEAFYGCGISNLIIEDSSALVSIGKAAFDNNKITKFKLPTADMVEIGTWGDGTGKYYEEEAVVTNLSTSYGMVWSPVANFAVNPRNVKVNFDVEFTDFSLNNPTEWRWDFGDGEMSNLQNPIHTYKETGKYTVKLTINNAVGSNTLSRRDFITVVPDQLEFETHPLDLIAAPTWDVTFAALSNTEGVTYRWQSMSNNAADSTWVDLMNDLYFQDVDSATLRVNNIQQIQDQQQFRVIIERNSKSDTSEVAILTVLPAKFLKVWPNPVKDVLNVELVDVRYSIKITNYLGQVFYTSPLQQQHFSISLWGWKERGVYFIHLLNEKGETINVEKLLLE